MTAALESDSDVIAMSGGPARRSFATADNSKVDIGLLAEQAQAATLDARRAAPDQSPLAEEFGADHGVLGRVSLAAATGLVVLVVAIHWLFNKTLSPAPDIAASALVLALTGMIAVFRHQTPSGGSALWLLDNARSVGLAMAALAAVAFFPISLSVAGGPSTVWWIHGGALAAAMALSAFASNRLNAALAPDYDRGAANIAPTLIYMLASIAFAAYSALAFAVLADRPEPADSLFEQYKQLQILCLALAGWFFVRSRLPLRVAQFLTFRNRAVHKPALLKNVSFEHAEISEYGMKLLMRGRRPALPVGIGMRGNIGRFGEAFPEAETFDPLDYDNDLAIGAPVTFNSLKFNNPRPGVSLSVLQGGRPDSRKNRLLVKINLTTTPPDGFALTLNLRPSESPDEVILDIIFSWDNGDQWSFWAPLEQSASRTPLGAVKIWFLRTMLLPSRKILKEEHQQALERAERIRAEDE